MCINVTPFPGSAPWCKSRERGREVCACCLLGRVRLFETPWTLARQAPPSTGVSRQGYWSRLLFPPPGALPDPSLRLLHCRRILYRHGACEKPPHTHSTHLSAPEREPKDPGPLQAPPPPPRRATEAAAPPCRSTPSLSLSEHQVGEGRGRGWSWTQHTSPSLSGHGHSC